MCARSPIHVQACVELASLDGGVVTSRVTFFGQQQPPSDPGSTVGPDDRVVGVDADVGSAQQHACCTGIRVATVASEHQLRGKDKSANDAQAVLAAASGGKTKTSARNAAIARTPSRVLEALFMIRPNPRLRRHPTHRDSRDRFFRRSCGLEARDDARRAGLLLRSRPAANHAVWTHGGLQVVPH
jgi:hypothetical protein